MRVVDSHFHWYPESVLRGLLQAGSITTEYGDFWFDLPALMAHMETTSHNISVVSSAGLVAEYFSAVSPAYGHDATRKYNEAMAQAQQERPGSFAAACAVPLQDTGTAVRVLNEAVQDLGLHAGVSLPGKIGHDESIDAPRLGPFYDRVEELGIPILLHPTDAPLQDVFPGYDGALHASLGRVMDVSVSALRLILSGIMERHPDLKVIVSHTGGALPYQAGRLDKNAHIPQLPLPPSAYLRRMYTDTVSPSPAGIRFAIDFFGADHVLYGSDYPCWNPEAALGTLDKAGLSETEREMVLHENATRVFGLAPTSSSSLSDVPSPLG